MIAQKTIRLGVIFLVITSIKGFKWLLAADQKRIVYLFDIGKNFDSFYQKIFSKVFMAKIGTYEWAKETKGKLSFSNRLELSFAAVKMQLGLFTKDFQKKLGLSAKDIKKLNLKDIEVSQTAVVKASEEFCRSVSSVALLNHCLRTYSWGALLALRDGIDYNKELLYIAALLHDISLTEKYWQKDPSTECFAVEGSKIAEDFLAKQPLSDNLRHKVREAISLHLNIVVGLEFGAEAHLLHEGAAFDVIGNRFDELNKETIEKVVSLYPRPNFKSEITTLLSSQAEIRPKSRTGFFVKYLHFNQRVKQAPFEE